jgi:hypothetical protein
VRTSAIAATTPAEDLEEGAARAIEEHGIELPGLMVAAYAVSDAPCRRDARDLDIRRAFACPTFPDADETRRRRAAELRPRAQVPRKKGDADPERARILEQRKAQKAERRAAASHEREARAAAQKARREALHASKRARP